MRRTLLATSIVSVVLLAAASSRGALQEICNNGIDDDGDGLIDCADSNCASDAACDFESGCCILIGCDNFNDEAGSGGGAGQMVRPADLCFDNSDEDRCASRVGEEMGMGGGAGPVPRPIACETGQLVPVPCSTVQACPQFSGNFNVPTLSVRGLSGLVALLAGLGAYYSRRRRPAA